MPPRQRSQQLPGGALQTVFQLESNLDLSVACRLSTQFQIQTSLLEVLLRLAAAPEKDNLSAVTMSEGINLALCARVDGTIRSHLPQLRHGRPPHDRHPPAKMNVVLTVEYSSPAERPPPEENTANDQPIASGSGTRAEPEVQAPQRVRDLFDPDSGEEDEAPRPSRSRRGVRFVDDEDNAHSPPRNPTTRTPIRRPAPPQTPTPSTRRGGGTPRAGLDDPLRSSRLEMSR
ncbi:hypothetical protein R3P38DRAFT_3242263 [Favolaschia claudopus]|uniref:Uncharacterized protein n=1 Tax=Favolaschia claudopus TaxID=2862362 RepID=A0AAV9Z4X3_9AGAR